jgi:small subunit ribosomal protein S2
LKLQREFHECGTNSHAVVALEKPENKSWDSFALEHMIACGLHLGHSVSAVNRNMAPYIYGVRQGIHIIDLDQTMHCLKRALFVTREIARLGGIILIVGTRPSIRKLTYDLAIKTNSYYIFEKWQRGTITNACYVVKKTGSFSPGTLKETTIRLPDLMIILDGPSNTEALVEATMRSVPSICLTDTNMDPTLCTYPIPVNDDSVSGTHFIVSLLEKAIIDGKSSLVVTDSEADDILDTRIF